MPSFIWVLFTTGLGSAIGHYGFDASAIGALIGLVIGILTALVFKTRAIDKVFDFTETMFDFLD